MHSLETGIVLSIAGIFFLTFLAFVFLRETNISKEIDNKVKCEVLEYNSENEKKYAPELINNILNIIVEGGTEYVGEDEE